MTCYQRHLTGLFERLDLAYDPAGRASVHRAILDVLDMTGDARCPEVWRAVKAEYGPVEANLDAMARDVAAALRRTD
jgi:hypothetical protein